MAEEKIIFKVVVDDDGNIIKLKSTQKGFQDIDLTVKNAEKSAKKLNETIGKTGSGATLKSINVTRKEYEKLANTQSQVKDATGSATSATMELSRVISDAPYGIRGMANNITQLVSQLGTASTKAGGLTAALKLMWSQLMGPLGVVFAITAAVSAFDFFYGGAEKAKKSIDDLTSSVYANALVANQYVDTIEDITSSEEQRAVATQELIKLIPSLKEEDFNYGENLDLVRGKIKLYALAQASRIEMDKLVQENSEVLSKRNELNNIKSIKDDKERLDEMQKYLLDKGGWLGLLVEERVKDGDAVTIKQRFGNIFKTIKEESDPILEQIDELSQSLTLDPDKKSKGAKGKRPKAFTLFTPESIDKQVKFGKKLIKSVAKAMGVELGKNPVDLNKLIDVELSDETKAAIAEYNRQIAIEMALTDKLLGAEGFVSKSQEVLGSMTDFMNAQFKRELTVEQNKTNALNVELNNRLNNENLSKDERAKIQNQIAINDENLRVKQEKIAKKQFDMNKASNIANALMDTSTAAIGVMKDAKGGFFARLSQALPTIAFGLAQVAAISRQKFQTSAAKTPINVGVGGASGGAGGSERSEPSFNIVGRSGENLLINAIQAQFDKPLKAYVVSRDVTTQQQLDGMIVGQAGT
jgi:hypothetical protein